MAKKGNRNSRRSRGMKKIEPSELTLTFATTTTSPNTIQNVFIDLSQVACLVNRRFYRQGLNWAVNGFKFLVAGGTTGAVAISKLPNTWVMSNAWEKGFRHWNRQQKEALAESSEGVRARYQDFKIYADADHHTAGYAANLIPVSTAGTPAALGEWQPSQIVVPNHLGAAGVNVEPEILAVGAANLLTDPTKFSLIEAYANSRNVPQSPDPAVPAGVTTGGENIYRQMFDVGADDDMVMDNAVGKNNDLPYPQTDYPGGDTQLSGLSIHDQVSYTSTSVGGQTFGKGGNFPCGLIKLSHSVPEGQIAHNLVIQIDLVPGPHRGYMCQDMKDM